MQVYCLDASKNFGSVINYNGHFAFTKGGFFVGRSTDYSDGIYSEKKAEIDPEVVKQKIGNSAIDAAELATFLTKYSRRGQPQSDKNIRRKIKAICKKSDGLLKEEDFMQTVDGTVKYVFKPEYHGFIIPLIDSTYLLDGVNKRKLQTRRELMEDLIVNIETYMSQKDLEIIKSNPAYNNAKLECLFSQAINGQLTVLIRELFHADEVIRYQEMKEVLDKLVEMNHNLGRRNAHIDSSKLVYGHQFDSGEDGEYKRALLQADSIGDFIVYLLGLKMKGKSYEYLSDDEELSYPALWAATKMYEQEVMPFFEVGHTLTEMDVAVGNIERLKKIKEKAKEVFDLDDPQEMLAYKSVIRQAAVYYAAPFLTEKDYIQMVRFMESAMAETKWDLLQRFLTEKDWDSPFLQELRRINSLRGINIAPDNLQK